MLNGSAHLRVRKVMSRDTVAYLGLSRHPGWRVWRRSRLLAALEAGIGMPGAVRLSVWVVRVGRRLVVPNGSSEPVIVAKRQRRLCSIDEILVSLYAYPAIGIDLDGHKDILGMWFGEGGGESAKFWMAVLTDLRHRGVADVVDATPTTPNRSAMWKPPRAFGW